MSAGEGETLFYATCSTGDGSHTYLGLAKDASGVDGIVVLVDGPPLNEDGERCSQSVILEPGDARRAAAILLNAADKVEGRVPLVFYPHGASASD